MNTDACFELGFVQKTHGLDGTVTVKLDVDEPLAYEGLDSVFLEINKKLVPFFVEFISVNRDKANIKFEDVDSIEQAEALKGAKLYLPLEVLPELEEGQFYYHQIVDYQVVDVTLGKLGVVKTVYEMPGQDLVAMEYQQKEVLIPVSDEVILAARHEEEILEVKLPEGLLDIYLED